MTDPGDDESDVALRACDLNKDSQVWDTSVPKRIARAARCLDLETGRLNADNTKRLLAYTCSGSANQQWDGLRASNSLLLALLSSDNLRLLQSMYRRPNSPANGS